MSGEGYGFAGRCFKDEASLIADALVRMPQVPGYLCEWGGGVGPAFQGTALTGTLGCRSLTSGEVTQQSFAVQIARCEQGFGDYGVEYLLFVVALIFAAFVGFRTGYRS